MNERIKELAKQVDACYIPRYDMWQMDTETMEKFAELIVRECAQVARATPSPNFHEHLKQQLGHTWDMASSEAGREIIKHFGVEK
jgi:hypothetical protein